MGRISPPWSVAPGYTGLVGFDLNMVMPDLLHCWNLGTARDLLGSCLKIILGEHHVFAGPTLADRLAQASESLRAFAKRHRHPLRTKKLTKGKLTWKSRKYPSLGVSGYDAAVIGQWLESVVAMHSDRYPEIASMLWLSNRAIGLIYHGGMFLNQQEKATLDTLGFAFLRVYMHMARGALLAHKMLWRVRPKLHLLCHCFRSHRAMNPARFSTWMDEDYLKKCGRTMGLTDSRGSHLRFL